MRLCQQHRHQLLHRSPISITSPKAHSLSEMDLFRGIHRHSVSPIPDPSTSHSPRSPLLSPPPGDGMLFRGSLTVSSSNEWQLSLPNSSPLLPVQRTPSTPPHAGHHRTTLHDLGAALIRGAALHTRANNHRYAKARPVAHLRHRRG